MNPTLRRVALIGILLALVVLYAIFDPAESRFFPQCIFHRITRLQCPGCGAQRMFHALLQGDIAMAFHYNALLVVMLPLLIFMAWLEMCRTRYPRLYARFYSTAAIASIGIAVCVWLIIRNIFNI